MKHKDSLTPVYLFAGGVLFYTIAMPCLDSLSCVVQSACNRLVAKWQMDLNEAQAESNAAVEVIQPANQQNTNAIGFDLGYTEGEDDDWCDKR